VIEHALREGLAAGGLPQRRHETKGLGHRQVSLHLSGGPPVLGFWAPKKTPKIGEFSGKNMGM